MARKATGTPAPAVPVAAEEIPAAAPVQEETTMTAVAEAPATETATEEKVEPDLSTIHAAVAALPATMAALVTSEDGEVSPQNFAGVVTAYEALDRAGKAAATRELGNKSRSELESGNFELARIVLLAEKATKASKSTKAPRATVDPTEDFVSKLAAFQLAYGALAANKPANVAEDWEAQVKAAFTTGEAEVSSVLAWRNSEAEDKGDAPEVSAAATLATKIAFGMTYGARHDVGKHLEQVFSDKPSGTFISVKDLGKLKSAEYSDSAPGTSAIQGRLNGKKSLPEGLSETSQGDIRGVVKA